MGRPWGHLWAPVHVGPLGDTFRWAQDVGGNSPRGPNNTLKNFVLWACRLSGEVLKKNHYKLESLRLAALWLVGMRALGLPPPRPYPDLHGTLKLAHGTPTLPPFHLCRLLQGSGG